ncbi:MAG: AraC family transcriptional regulator [Alloprevotella sp.]|nr:AraC family transcriptional regulator [Alloprevotella sp.]
MNKKQTPPSGIHESNINILRQRAEGFAIDDELLLASFNSKSPITETPCRLSYFLIALCRQGRATLQLDTEERHLYPGDLLTCGYNRIVGKLQMDADFEAQCFLVSHRFFSDILSGLTDISRLFLYTKDHPVVALTRQEVWLYSTYWDIIRKRTADIANPYRTPLVRTLALALIYELGRTLLRAGNPESEPAKRSEYIFRSFIRLLEENFREQRSVDFYAKALCISPKHLAFAVRSVSHQTPHNWINTYVVREARLLLRTTSMSVKEIALTLSFPSQSFFGTYFKTHTGLSPSAFRQKK